MTPNTSIKNLQLLLWVILALTAISGCKAKETKVPEGPPLAAESENLYWQIETRDDGGLVGEFLLDREGNAVPLKQYHRMAVLSPGAVETLYLIGGEGAIGSIASSSDPVWPAEKTSLLPSVGNVARPSLEALVNMESDLVIGNGMNSAFIKDYTARGGAALIHNAESIADILNSTLILGRLCGREDAAEKLNAENREFLAALQTELAQKPLGLKGAFLYSVHPIMASTANSLAGDVLAILGVENIAAGLPAAQPILSPEYILTQNPDFLFGAMSIRSAGDILAADSVILQTRAGREGNIAIIPSSYFLRPSPRLMEGIVELREKMKRYGQD
jgi:iron complex transport system substrate-binding protein